MIRVVRSTAFTLAMLLCSLAPASASGPVDCEDRLQDIAQILDAPSAQEVRQQWAQHDRLVREAEPGTAYYAPHPFPKSPDDVVADFRYAYFEKLFDGDPSTLEASERLIYEGLQSGTVKETVARVENWSLSRCSPSRKVPFYHLVRLFGTQGEELARASILPTGLMGRYAQVSDVGARAVPDLAQVPTRVEALLGKPMKLAQPRYATLDGLPLDCGPLVPCAVFEARGSTWILDRSALLFEVPPGAPRRSVASHRQQQRDTGPGPLGPSLADKVLVTAGFEWVEASLVARDEAMARLQGLPAAPETED